MTEKNTTNNSNSITYHSYTTIQDYFLAHWVNTIGIGPAMLYIQLLSYCHKGKDTAWPSIKTLNKRMVLPQSYRKENDEEEKIIETEEVEPESKIIKPEKLTIEKKPKEEKKRLSQEEELKWIRKIRYNVLK